MRFTLTVVCLIGVATILNACASGDSAPDSGPKMSDAPEGTPAADVSAEFEAAAQTTAVDSLLMLTDFPEGWAQTPRNPNDPDLGLTGDCAVLEADGLPGDIAHAVSDDFSGPAEQQVSMGTSIFADATAGEQAFSAYASTVAACGGDLTAKYEQAIRDEWSAHGGAPESISDLATSWDRVESSVAADASMAYRLLTTVTVDGRPTKSIFDVCFVRQGKVLGYLSYHSQDEPSAAEEAGLAQALATKLRAGDGELLAVLP